MPYGPGEHPILAKDGIDIDDLYFLACPDCAEQVFNIPMGEGDNSNFMCFCMNLDCAPRAIILTDSPASDNDGHEYTRVQVLEGAEGLRALLDASHAYLNDELQRAILRLSASDEAEWQKWLDSLETRLKQLESQS